MGRHRWTDRLTIEDCPQFLCAGTCHSDGVFAGTAGSSWRLFWFDPNDAPQGSIDYTLARTSSNDLAIQIPRQCLGLNTVVDEQTIPITTVRPHFGGKRFWFLCACGRRSGKLYLPRGQQVFRCRFCHNLTYKSTQTHDQRVYDLARDPVALQLALRGHGGDLKRLFFGMKAAGLLLGRYTRERRRHVSRC